MNCWEKAEKQWPFMVHSGTIWIDVLEIGTAEKIWIQGHLMVQSDAILNSRTLNGVFWRTCNLKRYYGNWNCWENFKSKDAKRCILTLFEIMFSIVNSLIKDLFMLDPLLPHFYCFFAHLKVIYFFGFQFKRLLKRVCHATPL